MGIFFSRLYLVSSLAALLFSLGAAIACQANAPQAPNDPVTLAKQADQLYDARDFPSAAALYRKAAELHNPHAMTHLRLCYDRGDGVKKDFAEATRWYRAADAAGDLEGAAFLGGMYADGAGVPVDYPQALALFRKSANGGAPAGMNRLGLSYERGAGVPHDAFEAKRWYLKAADLGDKWAMHNMGNLYLGRTGLPKDDQQAFGWYLKAANLGEPDSMVMLGAFLEHGANGIEKNPAEALVWYKKALALGAVNAADNLSRFGQLLFDLNGVWEGYLSSRLAPDVVLIEQTDTTIKGTRLTADLTSMGLPYLRGTFGDDPKRTTWSSHN